MRPAHQKLPETAYDEVARILIEEAERLERDQQAEHGRQAL
jgi:hypothetical protein